eukprot:jgi/Mesen1/2085/ME000151S01346
MLAALTGEGEGDSGVGGGLEWMRSWVRRVADDDPDEECSILAVECLRLHQELARRTMGVMKSASPVVNSFLYVPKHANCTLIMPL